jgi:trk system potassium uptake protein TrkA
VAFLIRFGAGLLPNGKTVIQAEDSVFAAAVSGQVASAVALAAAPPAEAE